MNVRRIFPVALLLLAGLAGCTHKPEAKLIAGMGSAGVDSNTLLTALAISNDGEASAEDVNVTAISVAGATLTLPATLPSSLGAIAPDHDTTLNANFTLSSVAPDTNYPVRVAGTFREHGRTFNFDLQETVRTPAASPGSGVALTGSVPSLNVTGAHFPPQRPNFGDEINEGNGPVRRVPSGPVRPLTPSAVSSFQPAPSGSGGGGGTASISFPTNAPVGINSSTIAEPSGASGGGVVFETANWYAAYSTGGSSFTQLNPTTIFPNAVDNGFCCDQIVQYVPSIDRFIWVMQYGPANPAPSPNPNNLPTNGPGLYRIASASPATIKSSGGTSWSYFDITSQAVLGTTNQPWLDYPDVTFGNNFLYLSADDVNNFPSHVVVRISLSDIKAGGTINFSYTKPSDSGVAWGGHLCQNSRDQIFWAGHNNNSSIRVFNWPESTGTYSWRDISIGSWPATSSSNKMTSATPDKQDWLTKLSGFPGNAVLGIARSSGSSDSKQANQLYLAWTGAIGNGFKQPHVQWIALDINNNFSLVSQQQVWNASYAFAYPAFAVNSQNGIGMSLEFGGGGNYENHVAGFWGDFVVYQTTNSAVGTTRFGDYVTIRQNTADPTKFDAFGYGLNQSSPPGSPVSDVHYIVFGR